MRKAIIGTILILAARACVFGVGEQGDYAPAGYEIETVATPKEVLFHATGLDIDKKGTVFVATRFGDVWRLENERDWSLYATGLHEPAGLLIDDDGSIVVAQKPELTRLVDLDKDGVADEYVSLASGWEFHDNYHEFHFGPVKDPQGNYHGTLNLSHRAPDSLSLSTMGSPGGYRGWAYRVTPDGAFEPYASGMRSPAGLGASPEGEIFYIDNQGDWVGTSKMHLVLPGEFYGHPVSLRDQPGYNVEALLGGKEEQFDAIRTKPVVWIPHAEVANSPGNPEWDTTGGAFGPFQGQIFVGDQTQSNLFRISLQKVGGAYQGMVVNFMSGFQSGNIRLRFDPKGALWVGQTARGWAAKGNKLFGLQKVVWNGTNPFEIHDIKLTTTGFRVSFTEKLDPATVRPESLDVKRYHYIYSRNYGSPKEELEPVAVAALKLLPDGKTLEATLPLKTDKVYEFDVSAFTSRSGRKTSVAKAYYTLNQLLSKR